MLHARRSTYTLIAPALPTRSSWAHDRNVAVQALIKKTKSNIVIVKGGTFKMGDFGSISTPDKLPYTHQDESKPLHDVELDSFSIGKYKVTHEDFEVYSSATGTPRIAELKRDRPYRTVPNVPAGVNWHEANDYCLRLGRVTNLPFDLPSEAQWEYAARSRGKYHAWAPDNGKYDDGRNLASYELRRDMMAGVSSPRAYPVGKLPQFPWHP